MAADRWKATFKNSAGGELDSVSSKTEEGLKRLLREKIRPDIGWTLGNGDTIEIEAPDE